MEGGRSAPSLDLLVQLADALNVPAGKIVDEMIHEAVGCVCGGTVTSGKK